MNPEFINSQKHKLYCCDVKGRYLLSPYSVVALKWRNSLFETSAISQIIEVPLETANKTMSKFLRLDLRDTYHYSKI